jgi:hypothetical protein
MNWWALRMDFTASLKLGKMSLLRGSQPHKWSLICNSSQRLVKIYPVQNEQDLYTLKLESENSAKIIQNSRPRLSFWAGEGACPYIL